MKSVRILQQEQIVARHAPGSADLDNGVVVNV